MREILFRAKIDTDVYSYDKKSEWVYGYYTKYGCIFSGRSVIEQENDDYAVLDETVCQYTGLTDKNGAKIFEGDIVKHEWEFLSNGNYHHYEDFIVEFKDSAYYIVPIKKHENIWTVYLNPESEYEVVGNIYDTNI